MFTLNVNYIQLNYDSIYHTGFDFIRLDRAEKRLRMRHLRPSRRESAGKSRLKQQIPNVKSITER